MSRSYQQVYFAAIAEPGKIKIVFAKILKCFWPVVNLIEIISITVAGPEKHLCNKLLVFQGRGCSFWRKPGGLVRLTAASLAGRQGAGFPAPLNADLPDFK
jgi:hypothetical protein